VASRIKRVKPSIGSLTTGRRDAGRVPQLQHCSELVLANRSNHYFTRHLSFRERQTPVGADQMR
jgi:hypothetical protein